MLLIAVLAFSVAGSAGANGCTYTHGYWLSHANPATDYDTTWDLAGGPNTQFFNSSQSWVQVLSTQPKGGNAYYILAHQYIAAKLNYYSGADPTVVGEALGYSEWLFNQPHFAGCSGIVCAITTKTNSQYFTDAIQYANILSLYNEGLIGPGVCSE